MSLYWASWGIHNIAVEFSKRPTYTGRLQELKARLFFACETWTKTHPADLLRLKDGRKRLARSLCFLGLVARLVSLENRAQRLNKLVWFVLAFAHSTKINK